MATSAEVTAITAICASFEQSGQYRSRAQKDFKKLIASISQDLKKLTHERFAPVKVVLNTFLEAAMSPKTKTLHHYRDSRAAVASALRVLGIAPTELPVGGAGATGGGAAGGGATDEDGDGTDDDEEDEDEEEGADGAEVGDLFASAIVPVPAPPPSSLTTAGGKLDASRILKIFPAVAAVSTSLGFNSDADRKQNKGVLAHAFAEGAHKSAATMGDSKRIFQAMLLLVTTIHRSESHKIFGAAFAPTVERFMDAVITYLQRTRLADTISTAGTTTQSIVLGVSSAGLNALTEGNTLILRAILKARWFGAQSIDLTEGGSDLATDVLLEHELLAHSRGLAIDHERWYNHIIVRPQAAMRGLGPDDATAEFARAMEAVAAPAEFEHRLCLPKTHSSMVGGGGASSSRSGGAKGSKSEATTGGHPYHALATALGAADLDSLTVTTGYCVRDALGVVHDTERPASGPRGKPTAFCGEGTSRLHGGVIKPTYKRAIAHMPASRLVELGFTDAQAAAILRKMSQ